MNPESIVGTRRPDCIMVNDDQGWKMYMEIRESVMTKVWGFMLVPVLRNKKKKKKKLEERQ